MTGAVLARPDQSEYHPYFGPYVSLVPEGDLLTLLEEGGQVRETADLLSGLTAERAEYRYAPGKWSVKQVVGHVIDAERVFTYRALRFARGDRTPLPGYDEKRWSDHDDVEYRTLDDLVGEFRVVRAATLAFARSLTAESEMRMGPAGDGPVTVRALLYLIAGHERHHVAILRERYRL